jgi:DNA excision repair protein ERCC-3
LKENGYSLESKWKDTLEHTLDIISLPSKPNINVHEEEEGQFLYSADFDDDMCHIIKKKCYDKNFPLLEEYEFRMDKVNPNLSIELNSVTQIRLYQEKCLGKMFSNSRARSGIICLPCGAGKTLVGISALCTIKKSCIILCNTTIAVNQWEKQINLWATIESKEIKGNKDFKNRKKNKIIKLTSKKLNSKKKDKLKHIIERLSAQDEAVILISNYTMMSYTGSRSEEKQKVFDEISKKKWGLMILDEVHVAPANTFRKVIENYKSYCKLGLTATLVREDMKIADLYYMIGPKLYEANWKELQDDGYLARVKCMQVLCEMYPLYYKEYITQSSMEKKALLSIINPNKIFACGYLIEEHRKRGDKIIVFSDCIYAIETYNNFFRDFPRITGSTSDREREDLLEIFKKDPTKNVIFLSKVGDTSIDIPEANVVIQISAHFGSKRQEAQRLGRILRPKPECKSTFNAFFYSLVSKDTKELYFADKRQEYLLGMGYSFDGQLINMKTFAQETPILQNLKKEIDMKTDDILREIISCDVAAFKEKEKEGIEGLEDYDINELWGNNNQLKSHINVDPSSYYEEEMKE